MTSESATSLANQLGGASIRAGQQRWAPRRHPMRIARHQVDHAMRQQSLCRLAKTLTLRSKQRLGSELHQHATLNEWQ